MEPMNLLVIMSDEHNVRTLGCHGHRRHAHTGELRRRWVLRGGGELSNYSLCVGKNRYFYSEVKNGID